MMTDRVSVMHIITRMDMGGSAQNTLLTCLGLDRKRYRVILVTGLSRESRMTPAETESVESGLEKARRQGVEIIRLPALVRSVHPLYDVDAMLQLWRIIRREKPDIVHTHTSKAGILGRWAAWLARTPVIVHTPHGHVFYGHFAALFSKLFLLTERLTAPITHHLVALTRGERDDYLSLRLFADDRMRIIHSGVDIDAFLAAPGDDPGIRRELGIPERAAVVGTVGWLQSVKNPAGLLEAMIPLLRSRPDLYLVFVGKGDLESDLKQKAAEAGVDVKVVLAGWRRDIPAVMRAFDVFVLPSLNEGMGRVVVEAMASGRPVVASNVGGIPDMVRNGDNGFLVDPRDPGALRAAIVKLLDSHALRVALGEKGRETALRFSLAVMISKINALYESAMRDRP
ncbi:MAG: glycosyltransferase family 4 protein [Thermodesulfobacteriota bacterium]